MMQNALVQTITDLARPLAASLGLSLWGVELVFSGRGTVRIYVEDEQSAGREREPDFSGQEPVHGSSGQDTASGSSGQDPASDSSGKGHDVTSHDDATGHGVTIDQCAGLSRLLGLALEVEDCIPGPYVLEVSSPGLDRIFFTAGQLAGAVGRVVEITLLDPVPDFPGRRKFRGTLEAAPSPDASGEIPETGAFVLRLEDAGLPDAGDAELSFAFAGVKKARQVHVVPEKVLPGKGGAKKGRTGGGKKAETLKDTA